MAYFQGQTVSFRECRFGYVKDSGIHMWFAGQNLWHPASKHHDDYIRSTGISHKEQIVVLVHQVHQVHQEQSSAITPSQVESYHTILGGNTSK